MNAPTDETQGKARPTQLGMTTACHFQTCSQIPCFICNRKKTACCFLSLLAQCFLFICERGDRAPQMTREWLWRLPAWGGGENEMLHSVNARSGESWRRDKNVSIYANCCPDPPPGCHCLLSGEKIKGPSVLNLFPDSALFRCTSLLAFRGQARFHGGAERAAYPLVLIRGRKPILSL